LDEPVDVAGEAGDVATCTS